jgi:hypothetical protein
VPSQTRPARQRRIGRSVERYEGAGTIRNVRYKWIGVTLAAAYWLLLVYK